MILFRRSFPGRRPRADRVREPRPGWLSLRDLEGLWGRAVFTALDFETTGLDPRLDRICEIGAVRFPPGGAVEESFELLVNPGRPISPDASRVSGITDEMVREARPLEEALPELLDFLGDSILAAHNAAFDLGFLKAAAARAGLPEPRNRVADTCGLARQAFPGLPSYSLPKLALRMGLDGGRAHRACDDARTCLRLLELCARPPRTGPGAPTTPQEAGGESPGA